MEPSQSTGASQNGAVAEETTPLIPGKRKPEITPLPWFQVTIISLLRVTEPIAFVVCWPFVNQMVVDLGVVTDPKAAGYYAGLIEAIFSVAQLLTVFHWGSLSDRMGRKPVLLVGCLGSAISGISFGFSRNFATMVLTRSIAGFMNGNVVVIKSMLAEITDETNSSRAFAIFPLCYSIGTILASSIGAGLVNIGDKSPSFVRILPIFATYPYLLPCVVAGMFPLASGTLALFYLEETVHPDSKPSAATTQSRRSSSTLSSSPPPQPKEDDPEAPVPARQLLTRDVLAMMLNFGVLALQSTAFAGLLPLYCFTAVKDGGLGMDEVGIGEALSIRAVATILVQILAFPWLARHVGTVRLYRILMALFVPSFMLLPVMNILARAHLEATVWPAMWVCLLTGATANMAFSCNMLMVNDVAPNKRSLGAINGIAQIVASAMRAVGPFAASALFAYSIQSKAVGGQLVWIILTLVALFGSTASLTLRMKKK